MLQIKESKINNNIIGYKFIFQKRKRGQKETILSINNLNNNNIDQSE